MIGFSYPILILLTIIQVVSYNLYNGKYHPFAVIVMPKSGTKSDDTSDQSSCSSDVIQETIEVEHEDNEDVDEIKTDEGKLTEPDLSEVTVVIHL